MAKYLLRQNVYFCAIDDSLVFLDLDRDKYLGFTGSCDPSRMELENRDAASADTKDLVDALLAADLLTVDVRTGRSIAPVAIQHAHQYLVDNDEEFLTGIRPTVRFMHVLNALLAVVAAFIRLRVFSLKSAIRHVRARKRRTANNSYRIDLQKARELVRVYQYIRLFLYQSNGHCLLDSLAMIEFLAHYGLFPTWVLGVRTGPFYAHAWVQHDGYLFNDHLEITRAQTPILVA